MAHRSSSAALHAARSVLKFNTLTVLAPEKLMFGVRPIGGLKANEAHISIVIDRTTNVFQLASVRPELRYWQDRLIYGTATAPQISMFLNKVITAIDSIPKHPPDTVAPMVRGNSLNGMLWSKFPLSRASLEATKALFQYYEIVSLRPQVLPIEVHRLDTAKLIDVSLGLKKVVGARSRFKACLDALRQGKATEAEAAKALRIAGILLEYLPNYADREEETKLLV